MTKPTIQPGDRFTKEGNPPSIWVVERLIERPDFPVHVRLRREDESNRTVTIGLAVLLERLGYSPATAGE